MTNKSYWKKYYKTKTSQDYYNEISESIRESLINLGYMYEPITENLLEGMRKDLYISTFCDGAICKNLNVSYNIDKNVVQIGWHFNGKSYEVLI